MIARTLRGSLGAAAVAGLLLSATPAVSAPAASASTPYTLLRGAHFSPDTPGVDVYLTAFSGGTATLWLSKVGYGDVSGYHRVSPGLYAVSMRPHGAAASTPAALSWTLTASPGQAYTAAAVGMNKHLKGIVLRDDLSQPRHGNGSVRVIQAASQAPHVDVTAQGGPSIARDTAFATQTAYATVPAGSWPIVAQSVEKPALQARANVSISAGSIHTVVVLDAPNGRIALHTLLDATGPSTAPVGGVPAGGGAAAGRAVAPSVWLALGVVIAGALVAGTGLALRLGSRRRR